MFYKVGRSDDEYIVVVFVVQMVGRFCSISSSLITKKNIPWFVYIIAKVYAKDNKNGGKVRVYDLKRGEGLIIQEL